MLVEDLGAPTSYLTLRPGAVVYACDGKKVGKVEHVLADPGLDTLTG